MTTATSSAQSHSKKQRCLYCGNNPTSHTAAWIDSTLGITLSPVSRWFFTLPGGRALHRLAEHIFDYFWNFLVLTRGVVFVDDATIVPTSRGEVLYEAARARGWRMETVKFFGKPVDTYRLTNSAGKQIVFTGLPRFETFEASLMNEIDDKAIMKHMLERGDVPISRGKCVTRWQEAEAFFKTATLPVIVKPRRGSRGRHTVTFITELDDFKHAFSIAKQLGHFVIVEEHLVGSVYRATMIDGVLGGVLAGDPPRITGDGEHTIAELIEIKNNERHERVGLVRITDVLKAFLKRQGYTLETVLEDGLTIDLSEKIGLSYGGKSREVTPDTHPKLRAELERAARIVNDPVIGFDFISTDISADPDTVRWGIIECNAVPFINLHHDPLEGEPVDVAGLFLDFVDKKMNPV